MASTLQFILRVKGKSRPQTDVGSGGESRSGMHNPKVAGSSPAPATKKALYECLFVLRIRYTMIGLLGVVAFDE